MTEERPPEWCQRHGRPGRIFALAHHWFVRCEECEAEFLDWFGRDQYRGGPVAMEPHLAPPPRGGPYVNATGPRSSDKPP